MIPIAKRIGERLRNYRLRAGMTQEALAERAGLHHTYIGQIERGEKNITLMVLEKLLSALGVSFSELFRHLEPGQREERTPEKCYALIDRMDETTQKHIYQILCEISQIKDDS